MTVAVQPVFSSTIASGSSTVFTYPFKIVESTDLRVSVDGVVQTSGYVVSGVGNGLGGDVTFTVAPSMGSVVLLELDPILSRDIDYQQYGDFQASIVNADFDRMWKALQKFANDFKRSLKLPVDTGTDQVVNYTAGERANALLTFDAAGNLTITPITSIAVSVSSSSFTVDTFSGDGSTVNFTLSRDPGIKNNTSVFVDGVYIQKSAYSITGTTLTFSVAPALGTANVEIAQSVALTAGAPADGTVTTASLVDSVLAATTQGLAKMADGFLAASTAARAKMADKFVTLQKLADIATGKLLGNVSGVTGTPAEVSEASQAEAESGTVQTRWMSPLRVMQAIISRTRHAYSFTGTGGITSAGSSLSFTTGWAIDNSIPQNTEGQALLDVTIACAVGDIIEIESEVPGSASTGAVFSLALFVDSVANAIAATSTVIGTGTWSSSLSLKAFFVATSTSHTFKLRGAITAGTFTANTSSSGATLGGVIQSSISAKIIG